MRCRLSKLSRIRLRIIASIFLVIWIATKGVNHASAGEKQAQQVSPETHVQHDLQYVGHQQCIVCHKKEVDAWKGSHHDLAMQHANEKSVLGNFNNAKFEYNGITSTFYKKDDKYFINTDGPDGKLQDYQIRYTFGVEPLQQYLIAFPGGRLQALGIAWDSRPKEQGGQRWYHLYPDEKITYNDRLHWTRLEQNWNYMCAECHSTNLNRNYILNKNAYRTTWSEINVSCEACHGPASRHVFWANNKSGRKSKDEKHKGLVVTLDERAGVTWKMNEASGNAQRSKTKSSNLEIEICARCHSRRSVISSEYKHDKPFMDSFLPALLADSLYYPDGQIKEEVYVYGSFIQSRMYHQGVNCSDCHEPHSLELRAQGNGNCLQCHATSKYNKASHHFHNEKSKGGLCVECHMPSRDYMVIDGRHDHSIRIPRPDLSVKLNTPNACNSCHVEKSPLWASKQMETWYGKDWSPGWHFGETIYNGRNGKMGVGQDLAAVAVSPKLPVIVRATATDLMQTNPVPITFVVLKGLLQDGEPMMRLSALQALDTLDAKQRLILGFRLLTDPVRAVRIEAARILAVVPGSMLSGKQQSILNKAIDEYIQSQQANAERPEAHINLGLLYTDLQKYGKAEKAYHQAIQIEPGFESIYVNLADLYRMQGQDDKAQQILEQAVATAPEYAATRHALGLLYVRNKQMKKALQTLKEAYLLQKNNARYGYVYAVALNSNGHTDQAINILKKVHARHISDRDVLIALVSFFQSKGDRTSARHYAEKLIDVDPRYGTVEQLLKRLNK
jgi:Flp pilus assembly protein TadD